MINKLKSKQSVEKYQGFTLIEMLVVLFVISILVLLFVPNLASERIKIELQGKVAFEKVIKTQVELFKMNEEGTPTYESLVNDHYLTQAQADKAQEWHISLAEEGA